MYYLNRRSFYSFSLIAFFFIYLFTSSCISIKKEIYCKDLPDSINSPYVMNNLTPFVDPKIESNDILAITVQPISPSTNIITSTSTGTFNPLNGFLVDKNGYIELSLIGFVKVAGLTTSEARELLKQKAKEFFKDPVVNVRIANFDIIMLGDVARVGPINIPNEKVSIIDAIALAGDLPLTANRNNILLIRSEGDQKKFIRFDLTSKDIFRSPYFYLKQRDIIYIQPRKDVIQSSDNRFTRDIGYVTAIISLVSVFLIYKDFNK
jgi:polysaccharide export outer membrane protein